MIEAKAQGDYADRKGTVQNGEKNAVSMEIKVIKCKIFEKYTNISKVNS